MKLSAPIFRLKRRAKAMAREANIPLSEALNRVALSEGFQAWSHLAASYAKRDPATEIFARFEAGEMVLVGARPMQGKTMLALGLLGEAYKAGRFCAYFSLEHSAAELNDAVKSCGVDPLSPRVLLDTTDAICADYMITRLAGANGAVVVVDYLQALDHQRENPPLADQISALKAFAANAQCVFVFISQIDRRYDPSTKALPGFTDIRMPNRIDTSLFSKACFLRDGEVTFSDVGVPR